MAQIKIALSLYLARHTLITYTLRKVWRGVIRIGSACYHFHGPLARYGKLRVRMRRECQEHFPRHRRQAIPTCITARA